MSIVEYRLGLYEKSMPAGMSWKEMLCAGKEAGYDQVEISIDESKARLARLDWTKEERMQVLKAEMESGMPVRTMCLSGHRRYPLGSHEPAVRAQGLEIMRKAIELSCDLGILIIQLAGYDVYYEQGDEQTRAWFTENLRKSVESAARYGVMLGFETMETPFMDTISKGMAYVKKINSPYLGMYPDLGNLTNACETYGLSVKEEIQSGDGAILAMHLKETVPGKYRDMEFGAGRVDFAEGIEAAYRSGVRLFTAEFWHDGGTQWRERLKRTNTFLRSKFKQAQGRVCVVETPIERRKQVRSLEKF